MGEVIAGLQEPSTWARIRGCVTVAQRADGLHTAWVARPGARPVACTNAEALAHAGRGAWIASALPAQQHVLKMLEAPFANAAKASKVFASLLDLELPFPLESCRTAFLVPRRTAEGRVATLAAAARNEDVAALLGALRDAGLAPATMDLEGLALWDEWQRRDVESFKAAAGILAVLEPGRLVVLCSRGGAFADLGVYRFDPSGSPAPELATRILRKLRSLPGFDRWTWAWAGPESANAPLCQAIETELAGDADLPPFRRIADGETLLESALARRLMTRGSARCNLLDASEASPALAAALRRRDCAALTWMAAAGAALLALSTAWLVHAGRMSRGAQERVDRAFTALTGQPNLQRGAEVLVAERMATAGANRAFEQAFEPGAELLLRELLRAGLGQAAAFHRIEWSDGRLTARGTVPDPAAAARIREAVEPFDLRCQVRVGAEVQPGRLAVEITADRAGEVSP